MQWRAKGRNRSVLPGDLEKVDAIRLKGQRAELLSFAAKRPGALAAHFLAAVRSRMKGPTGSVRETKELRDVSLTDWVQKGGSTLTEIRDVREVTTLAAICDAIQADRLEEAMDLITMRIHALQSAKAKGGSWDKAQKLELIASQTADLLPAGLAGIAV